MAYNDDDEHSAYLIIMMLSFSSQAYIGDIRGGASRCGGRGLGLALAGQ
jgi:hypothetical protein